MQKHVCLLIVLLAGCGPSKLLPPPPDMPHEIGKRPLWNTPLACIYARDKVVAGETETLVRQLSDDLQSQFDRPLGRGVVIVVDVGEEKPLIDTLEEGERLGEQSSFKKRKRRSTTQPTSGPSNEDKAEMAKMGITEETICRLIVAPLDETARDRLGLDAKRCPDIGWYLCCPSRRQTRESLRKMTDAALARKGGIAAKLLVAPWMPFILNEAVKKMDAGVKLVIVETWVESQTDWNSDRQQAVLKEMTKRLGVYDEIEMPGATTKPANSQPAPLESTTQPAADKK